jgi:CubicO group peptidase (beta-lactamase class C family)
MEEFGGYSAFKLPGQYIFVVPDEDLVAVFVGNHYGDLKLPRELMRTFILPAIRSEAALPPDPKAAAELAALVQALR